ncbi:MAG: 4-hydroxy-3-methylbut-2-enyl diphosphate reductase [Dehalococcoidia bacterium]|nr:MAG: 4-hydroxy-3-methylbut-2-enyl diphosphate reductase [Dehalococcoidia bacterium]
MEVKKAAGIGFCMGVRRAIDILEEITTELGGVETLGAVVHNQQVLRRLDEIGVSIVNNIEQMRGNVLVVSSHGVGPKVMQEIKTRNIKMVDTTCPFVKRAQVAARRLAESDFFTIVFGDLDHPEVKGILGWARDKGIATQDAKTFIEINDLPRHLGVLSQTTQVPADFARFTTEIINHALIKDSEIRIIDTICHDIRRRQVDTLALAKESELVLVVGGQTSANSRHLYELCTKITETHLIETASDINKSWLKGKSQIGVTSGASTDEQTIDEVITRLESID